MLVVAVAAGVSVIIGVDVCILVADGVEVG
jgi:hypothetical protein